MDAEDKSMTQDTERIAKSLRELGEHFDTVHIFCTRDDTDTTLQWSKGVGNFFARYGQIRSFLILEDESTRITSRKINED